MRRVLFGLLSFLFLFSFHSVSYAKYKHESYTLRYEEKLAEQVEYLAELKASKNQDIEEIKLTETDIVRLTPLAKNSDLANAEEQKEFGIIGQRVTRIQDAIANGGDRDRTFHAKLHGCYKGTFRLNPDRPEELNFGVFADHEPREIHVRFSNGAGRDEPDAKPDLRGIAVNIADTLHILAINVPLLPLRDSGVFLDFVESGASKVTQLAFFASHPFFASIVLPAIATPVLNLADETFWALHPYQLGTDAAVKYVITPFGQEGSVADKEVIEEAEGGFDELMAAFAKASMQAAGKMTDPNHLKHELINTLEEKGEFKFTLMAKIDHHQYPKNAPKALKVEYIELPSKKWEKPFPVGTFTLTEKVSDKAAGCAAYSPAVAPELHGPLGPFGRSRKAAYIASQRGRGQRPAGNK